MLNSCGVSIKAFEITSSIELTGIIFNLFFISSGISNRSFLLSSGIKTVLIPEDNKKDLIEVPKTILDSIEVITVKNVDEVLKVALVKPLKRVEWVEVDQISTKAKQKEELSTH